MEGLEPRSTRASALWNLENSSSVASDLWDTNMSTLSTYNPGTESSDGEWLSPFERDANVKVFVTFTAFFMVLGSWGNTLVIGAFFVNKKLRNPGNLFILNLAVADWLVCCINDPFNIVGIVVGEAWVLERFRICKVMGAILYISCCESIMSLAAISVNRYIMICHSQKYKTIYTFRNSLIMCIVTWMIALVTDVPLILDEGHVFDQKLLICNSDRTNFGHVMVTYPLFIVLVSCLICFCYYKIFATVRLSKLRVAAEGQDTKDRRETIKLAKTLFLIFIFFLIFWFPFGLTVLFDKNDRLPQWVYQYTGLIVLGNSCLNFILYAQGNREFRRAYAQLMCLGNLYNNRLQRITPSQREITTKPATVPEGVTTATEPAPGISTVVEHTKPISSLG